MHGKRHLDARNVSYYDHQKQALAFKRGPRGWPSVQQARHGSGSGLQRETNWQQLGQRRDSWPVTARSPKVPIG